jgi:hypothetical protein
MARILQDNKGNIPEIHGKTIVQLICVESLYDNLKKRPCLFLLKLNKSNFWYRFFLDASLCFWEKYKHFPKDDIEDTDDFPWYDLSDKTGLKGLQILNTGVSELEEGVELEIVLSNNRKIILSTLSFDGDTILEVL